MINQSLILVGGKGGVGKTVVSQALARALSERYPAKKILWICIEDPLKTPGVKKSVSANLDELNCDAMIAFEEYVAMKLRSKTLTSLFLQNSLARYLARAAPGIHELVLIGKIWYERLNYDHVVVDLPSTGYGIALFQCTQNFGKLFQGSPIEKDTQQMMATFGNPAETKHVVVSLAEEMPLWESLELADKLKTWFPTNPCQFIVNKLYPRSVESDPGTAKQIDGESAFIPRDHLDYIRRRQALEKKNLEIWDSRGIRYDRLPMIPSNQPIDGLVKVL